MEDYISEFKERTEQHIQRVNKYAHMLGENYPHHDEDKFGKLLDGYSLMHKKDCNEEEQNRIDEATYLHVISNEHHPEYWCDPESVKGFTRKNPNPHGVFDCSKMPNSALKEMCCDWCAMSEEFGNSPFEWFKKVKDKRWHFEKKQCEFILDILSKLWENKEK